MSDTDPISVPAFQPDFAARVVRKARAIRTRRRVAGAAVFAVAALSGTTLALPLWEAADNPLPRTVAYRAPDHASAAMQARQLELLFPDARPLVGFDRSYSAAMSGIRVDDQGSDQDPDYATD